MSDEDTTGAAGTQDTADKGGKTDEPQTLTLTQDRLDAIIEDRLAKERRKYADYDDVKTKAARLDEIEEESRSDLERAQKRAEQAEAERDAALERANSSLRRAAVVSEAQRQGAVDPDAVVALLAGDAVTIGDDGQVAGADDAVKSLLEAKPYLVGNTRPGPGDGGARPPATPSAGPAGDPETAHNELVAGLFGGPQ